MSKIIIVGGVAGGASAAARLRRLDEKAEIIMFERGEFISFANCGLPYYIGGEIQEEEDLTLQTPEGFNRRFRVDVRVREEVIRIDKEKKVVLVKKLTTNKEYEESYDKLILSPGSSPRKPNILGVENPKVFTLRNIPDTIKIKNFIEQEAVKDAVIVGGGYIGVEMAENLFAAGLNVTIVEFAKHVINSIDFDMAGDVHNHIRSKGVNLILEDGVKEIREEGNKLRLILGKEELTTDMVIMSVGVYPESKLATLAGLKTNQQGAIIVDSNMQTSDKDIYAVGDAIQIKDYIYGNDDYIPLAGPANKQGRIAADNIAGIPSKYNGTQGTGILKCFDLTVASTGISEEKAKRLNIDYVKSHTYSASHATYYPGASNMSMKLIYQKDGKLIGAQIVGFEGVDKRIDVLATAIRANMTVYDLTTLELAYAPPYSSAKDPVNMAGFVAENILTDKVKVVYPEDLNELRKDEDAIFLDIRTESEYDNGTIPGFWNITLDELRENLDKLDKTKPIYVTCQVGLRGYLGSRILKSNGFDAYNLSGGYRLYNSMYPDSYYVSEESKEDNLVKAANIATDNRN